jgi:hypothetical protein
MRKNILFIGFGLSFEMDGQCEENEQEQISEKRHTNSS